MKTLLFILLSSFSLYSQDAPVIDCVKRTPYAVGDVFVGVNSDASGVSFKDLSLTPTVGYAISNKEMLYLSGRYVAGTYDNLYLTVGVNRAVYKSAFIGLNVYYSDDGFEDLWGTTVKVGLHRELWKHVFVSPSIDFNKTFEDTEPFNISTKVTFGFRI